MHLHVLKTSLQAPCVSLCVQVHELAVQGAMAALLLLSGNWFTGVLHAALLAYMVHLYSTGRMHIDTTDAFRQLPQQKVQRGILLGSHLVLFVLVVYRLVSRSGEWSVWEGVGLGSCCATPSSSPPAAGTSSG